MSVNLLAAGGSPPQAWPRRYCWPQRCTASAGVAAPARAGTTTISFAESGLGTEGQQTATAIKAFEKANPSIKVSIDVLSPNSTTYLQQLEQRFIAGSSTPDVLESDVTYPAKFALAGWIKALTSLHPNMSQFFATEVAAGTYKGARTRSRGSTTPRGCSTGPT